MTESSETELGCFSISLSVKDIQASMAFYEKLGFEIIGGEPENNWCIMKNGHANIGLFEDMFPENVLTFNPGWDQEGRNMEAGFQDIRQIQEQLKQQGLTLAEEADAESSGPASIMLQDPDGNAILIDQHR